MSSSVISINSEILVDDLACVSVHDQVLANQGEIETKAESSGEASGGHGGICAICLDKIVLEETALIKGCEHAYCIHDYMFEESVCLLLRASWFKPLVVESHSTVYDDPDELFPYDQYEYGYGYEDEEDDLDDAYFSSSSVIRIGNRRWGDNGYVRAGRQEARPRPVNRPNNQDSGAASSSSREPRKEAVKDKTGRRAKRTLKREAADKAAAVKHQQHLARLGRQ